GRDADRVSGMENRIRNMLVFDARLDPTEAEIWISVYPERVTSPTRISGRLVGPRCPYSSTVEVAYPLPEHAREYETTGVPHITSRVIIPDPCLWEPQSPFLYEGIIELWQGDQRCDQQPLTCALRTLRLGARGVKLNGRPLTIQGTTAT